MNQTVRIAILDCDTTVPEVQNLHGPFYSSIFRTLLESTTQRKTHSTDVDFSCWDIQAGNYPNPENIDACIITGSIAAVYDSDPWILHLSNYISEVYHRFPHVRIFGSCFGHQLIASSLLSQYGVVVEKNPCGRQFGIRRIDLDPRFSSGFPSLVKDLPQIRMQVMHGDHVHCPEGTLPENWTPIGRTEDCAVQGLYQSGRVLSLQGHFEFDGFICRETLKHFYTPLISAESLEAALKGTEGHDDARLMAEIVMTFLMGAN